MTERNEGQLAAAGVLQETASDFKGCVARLHLLMGEDAARAFEAGKLLIALEAEQAHEAMGYDGFKAFLKGEGFKVSTAYSNMAIARLFDVHAHGPLGIGKLRTLASKVVADPLRLIAEGVPVTGLDGETTLMDVRELSYRELQKAVRALGARSRRNQQGEALTAQIVVAVQPLVAAEALAGAATPAEPLAMAG